MTPDEMLAQLNEQGGDAGSDFNDGDLNGWFGWSVEDGILTVQFEPATPDGDPGAMKSESWRLVKVEDQA